MAGWLHGVCVGECFSVFPLCGFSLSIFCNYCTRVGLVISREQGLRYDAGFAVPVLMS